MSDMAIRQVWRNNANGQLLITIPKKLFKQGDYLKLMKVKL